MSTNKEYFGESPIKNSPKKALSVKLGDKVVKGNNIVEGAVEMDHLSEDVHKSLEALQVGGVVLTGTFGNSEYLGINQKTLTEMKNGLESSIDNINSTIGQDFGEGTIKGRLTQLEAEADTVDSRIAYAEAEIVGNASSGYDSLGEVETVVRGILSSIEGLTQSEIIVGELPLEGTENTIYRVPGTGSYTDYAWNGEEFVPLAEYDNATDDEPTEDSGNLVKSGGVYEFVNSKFQLKTEEEIAAMIAHGTWEEDVFYYTEET